MTFGPSRNVGAELMKPPSRHDPHHLIEVAERDLDLGQKVDGARRVPRFGLARLSRSRRACLWRPVCRMAPGRSGLRPQAAIPVRTNPNIVGDRRRRRRENDTEGRELLFNLGHAAFL